MNDTSRTLILGLGSSGLAMARWCVRAGGQVSVADTRAAPPQLAALATDLPTAIFLHSEMSASLLKQDAFDRVLKSPGLSPHSVASVMAEAQSRSILCGNELSLFADALVDLNAERGYSPYVIGITGTNGKTTVTALTGKLVADAGKSVAVAGNIGPTLLETLAKHIDCNDLPEVWVLELSSFQLDGIDNFAPSVATVLNISQDHLDWHGTLASYVETKSRVYGSVQGPKQGQGQMLLNRDDARVMAARPPPVKGKPVRSCVTFGSDKPKRPGDYGLETVNGMTWLVRALESDETVRRKKHEELALHIQRLMPADALRIRGRHNAVNALAALALAVSAGCALAPLLHSLRDYRGEPHRVESIATLDEVEYFDDSKGTNVGATVAALVGLGAERRLVLIAGGEGKGQDFSPLAEPVARYVRAVVLIGRDASLIEAALAATGVPLISADSMLTAVAMAAREAHAGDAVLMSPACASFDMFDDYEHRARVFALAVQALSYEKGVLA
jgi:UDP-N-acetylmuramoylalanine--D-glutamate ligase